MDLTSEELQWAKESIIKTGLFSQCTPEEMQELLSGLSKEHYNEGAMILFQGEISSKLYLVEKGKVAIVVRKGKEKLIVAELTANAYFGEISLLRPRAATATVKAEESTDIIVLPGEVVQKIVAKSPVFSESINKKIDERLHQQQTQHDENQASK